MSSAVAVETPLAGPPVHRRSVKRNITLATLSAIVLLAVVTFFIGPTRQALAMSVSSSAIGGHSDVFYGKITNNKGTPLSGFHVIIYHKHKGHNVVDGRALTNSHGNYRFRIHGHRTTEFVQFKRGGVNSRDHFSITPGHAYDVSGVVGSHHTFAFFLPIFTY
jgi:hypothetical protein